MYHAIHHWIPYYYPFSLQQINHQIHYQIELKLKLSLIRFSILFCYYIFTLFQKCVWMIIITESSNINDKLLYDALPFGISLP